MRLLKENWKENTDKTGKVPGKKTCFLLGAVAVVVCICLIAGSVLDKGNAGKGYAIAEATYPERVKYPVEEEYLDVKTGSYNDDAYMKDYNKWLEVNNKQLKLALEGPQGLEEFMKNSASQFLSKAEEENCTYSPLNVYLALSMLAEVSDGESRNQILNALGAKNIENLREQVSSLWQANYQNDGVVTTLLANSLWMNDTVKYEKSTLETLAKKYFASSYSGTMGSKEYNKMLQDWLNKQTNGLLKEQADGIELSPDTIMAIASTIYFKGKWRNEFDKSNTKKEIFHASTGDITCDFMHESTIQDLYYGENFTAIAKPFEHAGSMWLILPNEGVGVKDLIMNRTVMNLPLHGGENKRAKVNLSMPKFDVDSTMDLINALKTMGIQNVFDSKLSDFTPMTKQIDNICVSDMIHSARVKVDEEGCEAAAFTVILETGAPMPTEEVDFTLDRPFLFVITGETGTPLFVGVVNQPVQ